MPGQPREFVAVDKQQDIRFLTIVSTLTRGGTERAAVNYALGYKRTGFPSAVLAYGGGGPRAEILEQAGIPIFVGGPSPLDIERASQEAQTWAPDILHLNRPGEADTRSALAVRTLIHPRLRVFETNVFGYVDRTEDRFLIDLHLQLSRWCQWKWSRSASDLESKSPSAVVPYSVECDAFLPVSAQDRTALRKEFGVPVDAFVFGRVGQATIGKWSPDLIHAFRIVAEKSPDVWLAVCGIPEELKHLIAVMPQAIKSRIVELPIVDSDIQLRRHYGLMDVFVHISKKGESFGMVLCEAMLSGLPVITMSTPLRDNAQIEVVRNGEVGLVVTNRGELLQAMSRVMRRGPEFEAMRKRAPAWVRANYDISLVNRTLVKLAGIALASSSIDDLRVRLLKMPECTQEVSPGSFRDLLRSAGIRHGLAKSTLTSFVNSPISRRAIRIVRRATKGL